MPPSQCTNNDDHVGDGGTLSNSFSPQSRKVIMEQEIEESGDNVMLHPKFTKKINGRI